MAYENVLRILDLFHIYSFTFLENSHDTFPSAGKVRGGSTSRDDTLGSLEMWKYSNVLPRRLAFPTSLGMDVRSVSLAWCIDHVFRDSFSSGRNSIFPDLAFHSISLKLSAVICVSHTYTHPFPLSQALCIYAFANVANRDVGVFSG